MKSLVAYGSKMGGTEGLAEMVGSALVDEGFEVIVADARAVQSVVDYDVVVLGGALYATRWHKEARRFVKRHEADLKKRKVWLFSSGPLDDSALEDEIPPVGHVRKAMDAVGARGHMTFGGRLLPDAEGFPASAMAKENAGDWRDESHVRSWVAGIAKDAKAKSASA